MDMERKELIHLAVEKGFKAKTLTTKWTLDNYFVRKSKPFINNACEHSLLCEIQKWLREKYNMHIVVINSIVSSKELWFYDIIPIDNSLIGYKEEQDQSSYKTYEKALRSGLYTMLKLIK